jgi:hypothetical protein
VSRPRGLQQVDQALFGPDVRPKGSRNAAASPRARVALRTALAAEVVSEWRKTRLQIEVNGDVIAGSCWAWRKYAWLLEGAHDDELVWPEVETFFAEMNRPLAPEE